MSECSHDPLAVLIRLVAPLTMPDLECNYTEANRVQTGGNERMGFEGMTVTRSVSVAELNGVHWIRARSGELDLEASREIRQACLHCLERGVSDIVIELTGVEHVSAEGLDALEAAADELRAKHGTLSLAARHHESFGRIDLRHVPDVGLSALSGLSVALDEALVGSDAQLLAPPAVDERRR